MLVKLRKNIWKSIDWKKDLMDLPKKGILSGKSRNRISILYDDGRIVEYLLPYNLKELASFIQSMRRCFGNNGYCNTMEFWYDLCSNERHMILENELVFLKPKKGFYWFKDELCKTGELI
jgi:hypothetical protein